MRKSTKFFGVIAVAGMIAASGSAFTATNTVAGSNAGSGTTAISGFDTTDIQYNANEATPTNLDSVTFSVAPAARYVAIKTHDAGEWVTSDDLRLGPDTTNSCTTADAGSTWTCDVPGATVTETVVAADNLSVVATS